MIRGMIKVRGDRKRKIKIEFPKFGIGSGEFVGVIGANGSGKSTFLDILGLILSPDNVDEFVMPATTPPLNLKRLSLSEKIKVRRLYFSYVLQSGGLLEFLSIRENIRFAAHLKGFGYGRVTEVVKTLGIGDIIHKRPGKVSGGQRQKAAIACALVQRPKIILADEPTSAMDRHSAIRLVKTFRLLTVEAGISLIMVTHDYNLIKDIADTFYHFSLMEKDSQSISSVLRVGSPERYL